MKFLKILSFVLITNIVFAQDKKDEMESNSIEMKFEELYEKYMISKASDILKDKTHPLFKEFIRSERSLRIIQPKTKTERFKKSFVPSASRRLRSTSS